MEYLENNQGLLLINKMGRVAVVPQCPNCKKYDVLVVLNKPSDMVKVENSNCSCGGFVVICSCGTEFQYCSGAMRRTWGMGCPQENGIEVTEEYCKQFM